QGGRRGLAVVPAAPEGARAAGRAAGDLGQVPGAGGGGGRVLPGGGLATVRRSFLPECFHGGAGWKGEGRGGDAQGDPRPGGQGGGADEGAGGGREAR